MNRPYVPQPVLDAAHARSAARLAQRWDEADRLRAEIEAAGWRVIDSGTNFRLEPAALADAVEGDLIRYGRSAAVPDRRSEASSARASVLIVATDAPSEASRTITSTLARLGPDDQLLVIVDGPDPGLEAELANLPAEVEVIRTATRLGAGAALNIGLRRAVGEIVILLDPRAEPAGDFIAPLITALSDPEVVVAGARGVRTSDLKTLERIQDAGDATTITHDAMAFRRVDGLATGPVDEGFVSARHLDTWWSLALRDGRQATDGGPVGRALVVANLPIRLAGDPDTSEPERSDGARTAKRNFYRLLGQFRDREDLLAPRDPARNSENFTP